VNCCVWNIALYGGETGTIKKIDQKCLKVLKYGAGKVGKIIWSDHVRNEVVLHTVKEERNILHTVERRKSNWIGNILHVFKGRWK
jgi:hypothetical protein